MQRTYTAQINGTTYRILAPNIIAAWKEAKKYQALTLGHMGKLSIAPATWPGRSREARRQRRAAR